MGNEPNSEEISVRELRRTLAHVLNQVTAHQQTVYVTNHGRRIAAIVPLGAITSPKE